MSFSVSITTRAIEALDYIPLVSTGKSLIDLFVKVAVLPKLTSEAIMQSGYYTLVDDTSPVRSFIVALPILGNITIALFDLARSFSDITVDTIISSDIEFLRLQCLPRHLLHDKTFAHKILKIRGEYLPFFGRNIAADPQIRRDATLSAVNYFRGLAREIFYVSPSSQEQARQELGQKAWAFVSADLQDDRTIQALYYNAVPWTLKDKPQDAQFIKELLATKRITILTIYPYLHKELQKDPEFSGDHIASCIFHGHIHPDLLKDRDFAQTHVKKYLKLIQFFPDFNQERDFWLSVVLDENNQTINLLDFLEYLPLHLREDQEILHPIFAAHIESLKKCEHVSSLIYLFNKIPQPFKQEASLLAAYREAFMRLAQTPENTPHNKFNLKHALRTSLVFNGPGTKKEFMRIHALPYRDLIEEYFDRIIAPYFNDDQRLKETLQNYGVIIFGDKLT